MNTRSIRLLARPQSRPELGLGGLVRRAENQGDVGDTAKIEQATPALDPTEQGGIGSRNQGAP